MQATPKSPALEAHQNALKIIYSWTTPDQFDTAPALLKEKRFEVLKPTQIATLLGVIENQRKLYASKSTPITIEEVSTPTRVEAIAEEYQEIDEENFGPTEVTLASAVVSVESVMPETVLPTNNILGDDSRPPDKDGDFAPVSDEPKTRKTRTPKIG